MQLCFTSPHEMRPNNHQGQASAQMASTHSNHHLESAPGKRTFAGDLLGAICLVASHLKQLEKSNIVALEYGRLIAHETKLGKDYNRRIWK